MDSSPYPEDEACFDFLISFQMDLQAGAVRSVEEYAACFPEQEASVRREFERLEYANTRVSGADEMPQPEARYLGSYRLEQELGHGGQGTVFKAWDEKLERRVALKVISTPLGSIPRERMQRFRREAKLVARLEHAAICPIFEADLEATEPYIVMPFVEGTTLSRQIAACRLQSANPSQAASASTSLLLPCKPQSASDLGLLLAWFETIARALHIAHEANVVHRDVKPANLMVTLAGEPMLLDFGIAHARGEGLETLTGTGQAIGTPMYMAPEQLAGGESVELDRRADVYGLGACLYEALTLDSPHSGSTQPELIESVLHEPVPDVCARNPSLPQAMRAVLETALDKRPSRRYATAADFADDLARLAQGETVAGSRVGPLLRTARLAGRHPSLALGLVASLVIMLIASVLREKQGTLDDQTDHAIVVDFLRSRWRHLQREKKNPGTALGTACQWLSEDPCLESRQAVLESLVSQRELERVSVLDIASIAVVPGTSHAIIGSRVGKVRMINLASGERLDSVDDAESQGIRIMHVDTDDLGRRAVSLTEDGRLRLYALPELTNVLELGQLEGRVQSLAFRPSHTEFVTCTGGQSVRVWDAARAVTVGNLAPQGGDIQHVAYGPRGEVLLTIQTLGATEGVAGGELSQVSFWDADSLELQSSLPLSEALVTSLAFRPHKRQVALGDGAGLVHLVDFESEAVGQVLFDFQAEIAHVIFDSAGTQLAVCHAVDAQAKTVGIIDVPSRALLSHIPAHDDADALEARFDPAGKVLAIIGSDLTLRTVDVVSSKVQLTFAGMVRGVSAFQWNEDGSRLWCASSVGYVHSFYTGGTGFLPKVEAGQERVDELLFSRSGERVMSVTADGMHRLWESPSLEFVTSLQGAARDRRMASGVASDGSALWFVGEDGSLVVLAEAGGEWLSKTHELAERIRAAVGHPQENKLLIVSPLSPARLIDWNGNTLQAYGTGRERWAAACFDSLGEHIALASSKGIEIFDTESGERVEHPPIVLDSSLNGSGPEPISLAFVGKSGSFLAATTPSSLLSWDWRAGIASRPSYLPEGSIVGLRSLTSGWVAGAEPASEIGSLWSIGAGNTRSQLHGHVGVITCVTTEAGSDARVATGAEDRTLRVYEAANRNLWMVYPGLDSPATSVAFTRDGDYLLAGTMSGQLSAWPCDLAEAGEEAYVFEHHPLHGYEQSRAILVREGRAAAE